MSLENVLVIESPFYEKRGEVIAKIYFETSGSQVIVTRKDVISTVQKELDRLYQLIDSTVNTYIANTLAERDALIDNELILLRGGDRCWVIDASADENIDFGSAMYIWNTTDEEWKLMAESGSMHIYLAWENIEGKPESAIEDIDDAVDKRHSHDNKETLDKLGEEDDQLTYDGTAIKELVDVETGYVVYEEGQDLASVIAEKKFKEGAIFSIIEIEEDNNG